MKYLSLILLCLLVLAAHPGLAQNRLVTDGIGRIRALSYDGDWLPADFDLRVALPAWRKYSGITPWSVKNVTYARLPDGRQEWAGTMLVDDGRTARYQTRLSDQGADAAQLTLALTADQDLTLEGVFFFFRVPVAAFAGGKVKFSPAESEPATALLPQSLAPEAIFLAGTAAAVRLTEQTGQRGLELTLAQPNRVMLQDDRYWQNPFFSVFTRLHDGDLKQGQTVTATVTIKLFGKSAAAPAQVTVKPLAQPAVFDGFGGNFVYARTSPVMTYMLEQTRTAWARIQMSVDEWVPENDPAAAEPPDWAVFAKRDRPGSMLHEEFVTAQRLQQLKIPLCISVWRLPEWMYQDAGSNGQFGRRVAAERWPEVDRAVTSYLLYLKRQYGVEPELFSFNEPDYGVRVFQTAAEHRDTILRLGRAFAEADLRTRCLLGDVTSPGKARDLVKPAAESPEAGPYIGAVAFHSWGENIPLDAYVAWRDLAASLGKPLLVTEQGYDAEAWRTPELFNSFDYAVNELRRMAEVLIYARPQALMPWEYTDDYPLARAGKDAAGKITLQPTARFWFLKQLGDLTPAGARYLETVSDQAQLLVIGFAAPDTGTNAPPRWILHFVNLGAARLASVSGLPAEMTSWEAWCSAEGMALKKQPPPTVNGNILQVTLPALSLTTVTGSKPAQTVPAD